MTYTQLLDAMATDFINAWCTSDVPLSASSVKEMKIAVHDDFFTYCGYPL